MACNLVVTWPIAAPRRLINDEKMSPLESHADLTHNSLRNMSPQLYWIII